MKHIVTPLYNGITNIKFKIHEDDNLPDFENIPHFLFLITTEDERHIMVDTGFDLNYVPGMNSFGIRDIEFHLPDLLKSHGVDTEEIETVVMTHLHWDHTGGMKYFPNAEFYVQADEFNHMLHLNPHEETYYCPSHWLPFLDRISIVSGDLSLESGIDLLHTGGHTWGHQVVRVETEKGAVVLAGDEPFNYDDLWKLIPGEYWDFFKKTHGEKFYWKKDEVDRVQGYIDKNNLQGLSKSAGHSLDEFKNSGCSLFYTHDRRLKG